MIQPKLFYRVAKRLLDVTLIVVSAPIVVPVAFVLTCVVRFDSRGPALFRQRRLGLHGSVFSLLKFRSMIHNAPDLRDSDGSAYTSNDDSRVTRVGRLLRKASLDELPQLFNVLRGEMSLVGPRPDQVDQIRFYTETEKRKLLVRPGITGLAQINGRNNIPWEQRKALDIEYVNRQSFWLDLTILARTIPYVLLRKDINTHGRHSNSSATFSN